MVGGIFLPYVFTIRQDVFLEYRLTAGFQNAQVRAMLRHPSKGISSNYDFSCARKKRPVIYDGRIRNVLAIGSTGQKYQCYHHRNGYAIIC